MPNVPDGFAPHFRRSPVTDPWEPLYSRRSQGVVELGLVLAEPHCNARGLLHGGVIATLADNAMGHSFLAARAAEAGEAPAGAVTVSLSVDFAAVARLGQWVLVTPRVLKAGKSMGFVDALVTADGTLIARASGTFRVTP